MAKKAKQDSSKVWSIMSLAATLGGAALAKKGVDAGWKAATGKQPPENPADPDIDLWEAVAWAVASGTVVALVKMGLQRRAANYYAKSTGHLPPPLRKDNQDVNA